MDNWMDGRRYIVPIENLYTLLKMFFLSHYTLEMIMKSSELWKVVGLEKDTTDCSSLTSSLSTVQCIINKWEVYGTTNTLPRFCASMQRKRE